jgi:O-antigen ligase
MGFPISRLYIRAPLICFCAIIIGWQLKISEKTYKTLLVFFGCVLLYVAAIQIYTNVGALVIEQHYLVPGKNALGPIIATGVVAFVVLFLQKENNKLFNIFCLALAILAFVLLLTMRARAAMLMTLLLVVFVIYKNFVRSGNKYFFLSVTLTVFSLLAIYFVLPEVAKTYILDSFFYGREDDITSGRGERNRMAVEFLQDNLLFGNITGMVQLPWIHNFPLLQAYNFGIIGAFGVIALYFYLSVEIIKAMLKYDIFETKNIGFVLIAVAFGIAMAEPVAPFGPGTVFVFSFITFGIALRHNFKPKENSAHKSDNF